LQWLKPPDPNFSKDSGKIHFSNFSQWGKQSFPNYFTPSGKIISVKDLQPSKELPPQQCWLMDPMNSKDLDRVIFSNFSQP